MTEQKKKYKAFISYKHSVSSRIAVALETALRRYAKPIFKPPISIFRDEDQMAAGVDLKASIRMALENSDYLIYIASREAADSPYVQEELEIWCRELGRQEKLIIVWQKDELADNPQDNTVLWEASSALPSNLEPHIHGIPIWLDLTWASTDDDLNLRNPGFKVLVNSIMARFRGIAPEALTGVEIRTHRRNIRIRNSAIVVLAALIIVSLMAVTRAFTEREQARINQLTYRSAQVVDADPTLALRFAYEAYAMALPDPPPQIRQLLLKAFYRDDPRHAWRYVTKLSHGGGLKDALFSPDGKQVVTLAVNGSAHIWSVGGDPMGSMAMRLGIERAQFSDDGQLLLTTGYMDETIAVWNADGSPHDATKVPPSERPYAEFQPGGRKVLILSGRARDTVTIWDPKGKKITLERSGIQWARFTPDGSNILTYQSNGFLRRWTTSGQYKGYIKISRKCSKLELSPDGSYLLAMPDSRTIEQWGMDGRRMETIDNQGIGFRSIAVAPNGEHFAAVSGGTIRVWDRSGVLKVDGSALANTVRSCSFSSDSRRILAISTDRAVLVLDLTGRMIGHCGGRWHAVTAARFSPDGTSVLTAAADGAARVWNASRQAVIKIDTNVGAGQLSNMAFFPDRQRLMTLSLGGKIQVFDLLGKRLSYPLVEEAHVGRVHLSAQGTSILTTNRNDHSIKLWRQSDGTLLKTLEGLQARIRYVGFSPDGRYVIGESDKPNTIIWDTEGRLFPICKPFAQRMRSARFLPGGSGLLAFCKDGRLRILDFDGRIMSSDLEQETGIISFSMSPSGRYIQSAFDDNSFMISDHAGNEVMPRGESKNHFGVQFLPDDSGFVLAMPSGEVQIMDMLGTLQSRWHYPSESIYHSARISPDANTVVIPQNGEIRSVNGYLLGDLSDAFEGFFPDGQLVLTSTRKENSMVHIRDLSGQAIAACGPVQKEGHHPTSPQVIFSPDKEKFAVASFDGTVRIYHTASGIYSYLQSEGLYALTSEDYEKYDINWLRRD